MKCPYCNQDELKVTDSREAPEANAIRRRRVCLSCGKRFTTFETVELQLQVKKRDGRYEEFQPQKLLRGLAAACSHTTVSNDRVALLSIEITEELMKLQMGEISTEQIGEMVMNHLKTLDPIAYIRFACVYRRFKEISELVEAINGMQALSE